MVLLQKLSFLSLALSMVVAKNITGPEIKHNIVRDVRMHMGVRDDGIVTDEEVELNYEQNYVRVSTPGRNGDSPVVMIHDYNLNQTVYKVNGLCFLLDVEHDLPPPLRDWTKLEDFTVDGMVDSDGPDSYMAQFYKLLPFALNRTSLSPAIQQECPGDIMAVSLQDTRVQQEAYDYMHTNMGNRSVVMSQVFQPRPTTTAPVREKRRDRCVCRLLVILVIIILL